MSHMSDTALVFGTRERPVLIASIIGIIGIRLIQNLN